MQVPASQSSMPAPATPGVKPPASVPGEQPKKPRFVKRFWWIPVLVAVVGLGAWWYAQRRAAATPQGEGQAAAGLRTATVQGGQVRRMIRLTGTTAPENFAALLAPSLRGSRSGRVQGLQTASLQSPVSSSGSSSSLSASRSSSMSTSMQSSLSRFSGAGGGGAGASGSGSSSSTSSRSSSSSSSTGGGSSSSGGSSAAMGSGLGSTASQLSGGSQGPGAIGGMSGGGGGGGGRGRGDFGLILQELVPAGKMVQKGDPVATFDRENMYNRVLDYEAIVAQSEANMRKLRADYGVNEAAHKRLIDVARAEVEKARLDYKTAVVRSEIDTELLKLALEESEARLKQLQAEVKHVETSLKSQIRVAEITVMQAKNELERAKRNYDLMEIKAPMAGIAVLFTTWRRGEFGQTKQGDMVRAGQPFLRIVDPSSMVVESSVNQVDIDLIRVGQQAMVNFDAFPGLRLPAKVISIGAIAASTGLMTQYVKTVPVILRLEKVDPKVIPDLSVSVDIELDAEKGEVVAPLGAVFHGADGKPFVYVRKGQQWETRGVELGLANGLEVVVRSGLRPGEVVALDKPEPPQGQRGGSLREQQS